ncbi:MAG: hypothetical protein ABFC94_11945 [Syntrophomonas sp.]
MVYGIMGTGRSLSIIRGIAALSLCYAQQTILQLLLFWFACNRAKVMVLDQQRRNDAFYSIKRSSWVD